MNFSCLLALVFALVLPVFSVGASSFSDNCATLLAKRIDYRDLPEIEQFKLDFASAAEAMVAHSEKHDFEYSRFIRSRTISAFLGRVKQSYQSLKYLENEILKLENHEIEISKNGDPILRVRVKNLKSKPLDVTFPIPSGINYDDDEVLRIFVMNRLTDMMGNLESQGRLISALTRFVDAVKLKRVKSNAQMMAEFIEPFRRDYFQEYKPGGDVSDILAGFDPRLSSHRVWVNSLYQTRKRFDGLYARTLTGALPVPQMIEELRKLKRVFSQTAIEVETFLRQSQDHGLGLEEINWKKVKRFAVYYSRFIEFSLAALEMSEAQPNLSGERSLQLAIFDLASRSDPKRILTEVGFSLDLQYALLKMLQTPLPGVEATDIEGARRQADELAAFRFVLRKQALDRAKLGAVAVIPGISAVHPAYLALEVTTLKTNTRRAVILPLGEVVLIDTTYFKLVGMQVGPDGQPLVSVEWIEQSGQMRQKTLSLRQLQNVTWDDSFAERFRAIVKKFESEVQRRRMLN